MVKEVERAGFPIVQMCNLIPVATTVGANRMVPTISIPYPLGDPNTPKEEQWKLRYHRVGVALDAILDGHREYPVLPVGNTGYFFFCFRCVYSPGFCFQSTVFFSV